MSMSGLEPGVELRPTNVLGVHINPLSLAQVLTFIESSVAKNRRVIVSNVNVHAANLAYEQRWFRNFLNESDLVFCDGFGIKWGAQLLGYDIPHRFTPPDWIDALAGLAMRCRLSLFLLGARPGVAAQAATRLQARFPELQIAGTHHGHFNQTYGSTENEAVVAVINAVRPHLLLVGFGMPLQERWLMDNWDRLNANVAIPVGALFDYVAGVVPRGPRWMTDHGLEWLTRLLIEPRRLWRRYLIGNPLFFWRVLQQRLGILRFKE